MDKTAPVNSLAKEETADAPGRVEEDPIASQVQEDVATADDVNLNRSGDLTAGDPEIGDEDKIEVQGPNSAMIFMDGAERDTPARAKTPGVKSSEGGVVLKISEGSLSNLLIYDSDDSGSDSSTAESDSFESVETDVEQIEDDAKQIGKKKNINETARTLGELSLDDLPPVPDVSTLNIGVDEKDCVHIGAISAIVERLVMVESLPNIPAYDLDTLLFLEGGRKPLGYVYDVMGPVSSPIYVIRFNNVEDISKRGVTKGLPVYSAPKSEHTQYVFLKQLMQVKGSDASWMGDNEVPVEHADFSDDEEERRVRRSAHKNNSGETRKRNSLERHKDFEKDMNVKNLIDTRLHKIRDSFEPSAKKHASSFNSNNNNSTNNNNNNNNNEKRGYPFQTNCGGPNFGFSQYNLNANVPSFPPMFNMPYMQAGMHLTPFPNVPFSLPPMPPPHIPPPLFRANIPPPPPPAPPQIQNIPPPPGVGSPIPPQNIPVPPPPCSFPNLSVPPPSLPVEVAQKTIHVQPRMLFPPDMGLPRPQTAFVPPMPYYEPRVPRMWSYQSRPQNFRGPPAYIQPMRGNFFPKRP